MNVGVNEQFTAAVKAEDKKNHPNFCVAAGESDKAAHKLYLYSRSLLSSVRSIFQN
jgi:hypothetical protein